MLLIVLDIVQALRNAHSVDRPRHVNRRLCLHAESIGAWNAVISNVVLAASHSPGLLPRLPAHLIIVVDCDLGLAAVGLNQVRLALSTHHHHWHVVVRFLVQILSGVEAAIWCKRYLGVLFLDAGGFLEFDIFFVLV